MARRVDYEVEHFASVYDDHVYDVYGFFGYRLGSRQEAEDLTQATFERALRAWDRFDPSRATARTWLLAIANNLLIDHYRRSHKQESISDADVAEHLLGYEPAVEARYGVEPELERALGELSERERELIALRYGADLSGPEIAKLTSLSLDNVHQILSRSLRRLRARLTPDEGTSEGARASGRERAGAGNSHGGDQQQNQP